MSQRRDGKPSTDAFFDRLHEQRKAWHAQEAPRRIERAMVCELIDMIVGGLGLTTRHEIRMRELEDQIREFEEQIRQAEREWELS